MSKCFTCGIELHPPIMTSNGSGHCESSFATCFGTERICKVCEDQFERRPLPNKAVGLLAAAAAGYPRHAAINRELVNAVRTRTFYLRDGVSFVPASKD